MALLVENMATGDFSDKRLIDGLKLVLPTIVLVAVAFAFLRRANQMLLPVALDFATAAAIGITAGFSTRWTLRTRAGLLKWIVAVAMSITGLIILGIITWETAGLRMLYLRDAVDWNGIGQALVTASCALLALRAWPPHTPYESALPDTLPEPVQARNRPESPIPGAAESVRSAPAEPARLPRPTPRARRIPAQRRPVSTSSALAQLPRRIVMPHWNLPKIALPHIAWPSLFHFRESQVKFTGVTEQRCPYCLDVITKNDPRGVRVCSICHTPHHADCWALTGVCQVPHYHG